MSNLQNDHNVYILGAGFSREAGYPLISDFLNKMRDARDWLNSDGRFEECDAIDKLLEFRLNASSAAYRVNLDLDNIEDLFSLASASNDSISKDIKLAISATIDYLSLEGNKPFDVKVSVSKDFITEYFQSGDFVLSDRTPNRFEMEIPFYDYVVGNLVDYFNPKKVWQENTFLSFNYDLLLENSLQNLGVHFTYQPNHLFPLSKNIQEDTVDILKLHGSINWLSNDEKEIEVIPLDHIVSRNLSPYLIPPTWNKNFQNSFFLLWNSAIQKLSTATRIIIIGFSAPKTDNYFKYLLAAGLQNNISLREIILVNPGFDSEIELTGFEDIFGLEEYQKTIIKRIPKTLGELMNPASLRVLNRGFDRNNMSIAHYNN